MDPTVAHETFKLGEFTVPRLWTGLWQLSSNAWGTASVSKIRQAMGRHVDLGHTAFADHYGSAELIYGQFRASLESPESVLGATKWCVFKPIEITQESVEAAVRQRIERMRTERVDLLQFHWQDYANRDYIQALEIMSKLQAQGLISAIGLCNFDALHMDDICVRFPGTIVSNQVPFSVIDTRALYALGDVCTKHGVKLLTYGTLCGGFLAERWIGEPEPDPYSGSLNPSQRKYLDFIVKAWGSWSLFQDLLIALRNIGQRHAGASVSNIATRWVLDHPFVGAVIIGARLGCTEYPSDNLKVYGLSLTAADRDEIDVVLARSAERRLIETIGDCGAEYR
ncbi:NADP-dependent oxidoreductase domain-containing protein [Mycena maculata]|uniref:NADP-dependent oxidoreductase domain-containing protein n=1 Tax=Mycena maculata TaxID=230809 RepID=A0AAD7HFZ8_9AGAR|nr:NADP-dependent oxidoreductase domain-containing protein [Mycena maculata]